MILEPEHLQAMAAGLSANADDDSDLTTAPAFVLIFERAPQGEKRWLDLLRASTSACGGRLTSPVR